MEPEEAELEEVKPVDPDALEDEPVEPPPPPGPPQPFDVDADLIRLVGDRLFQARGRVEIRQDSLRSYGDSMQYQQDLGVLTLYRNARILSPDPESGDTLDLTGDTIDMRLPSNRIDELEARGRAHLLRGAVDMKGPILRIFFVQESLDRIVSVVGEPPQEEAPEPQLPAEEPADSSDIVIEDPFARPQATAEDFFLTGDSVEVKAPGGELESIFASGNARGISSAQDWLNAEDVPELTRQDWIEGQTITATFVTAEQDSTGSPSAPEAEDERHYRLDMLVAQGEARSFYRSLQTSTAEPGEGQRPVELNYVLGDEIRLFMKDGQVDRMEVDNATGAYFQPQPSPTAPVGDTVPPPPPDTTSGGTAGGNRPIGSRRR